MLWKHYISSTDGKLLYTLNEIPDLSYACNIFYIYLFIFSDIYSQVSIAQNAEGMQNNVILTSKTWILNLI